MKYIHIDRGKSFLLTSLSIISLLALWSFISPPAYAAESDSNFEDDLSTVERFYNAEGHREELLHYLKESARYNRITLEEATHTEVEYIQATTAHHPSYSDRSGGPIISRPLACARNKGDYFYTNSWTGIANHGHTGIYEEKCSVIEAPGPNLTVHRIHPHRIRVGQGTAMREVKTTQAKRDAAANKSRSYLGREYNTGFFNGNKNDKGAMHCAQLVWASYYYGAGIDLDSNWNWDNNVWPWDLNESEKATTYKTLWGLELAPGE